MKRFFFSMLVMALSLATVSVNAQNKEVPGEGFAVTLLKRAVETYGTDNVVVSPLSVSSALTLTANGAKGRTLTEMLTALQIPNGDLAAANRYYKELFAYFPNADTCTVLNIANAVWIDDSFKMNDSYRKSVEGLNATVGVLDLQNPKNASVVNAWASKNTNKLIDNVISGDAFVPEFRMLIANAVYFKGKWQSSFSPDNTRKQTFYASEGDKYEVQMMHKTANFRYTVAGRNQDLQVLSMDYRGDAYEMVVVLPSGKIPLHEAVNEITEQRIAEWSNAPRCKVQVSLPKFKIRWNQNLNSCLEAMGITQAFSNQARFGGMSDSEQLKISEVNHFTYLMVEENGTEAAAVTTVMMNKCTAMPRPEHIEIFNADHPFFLFIREKTTGAILFSAQIGRP